MSPPTHSSGSRWWKNAHTIPLYGPTYGGPGITDDLTPQVKDNVFGYQLRGGQFEVLQPETLCEAKITDSKQYAKAVFKSCRAIGVITTDGRPDTTRIDASMLNRVAKLSLLKCRELVNFLFFWEEETTRWRLLCDEETEISRRLSAAEIDETEKMRLEYALKIVQAKKKVPPSWRDESGHSLGEEALPSYER